MIHRRYPEKRDELLSHFGVRYVNAVEKLWRSDGRQVLSMNPDLLAEVQVATSTEIAPEVYRTIPFLNPMVVFAEPPVVPSWRDNETMRVLGFFVHGRSRKARFLHHELMETLQQGDIIMSSHDPDMDKLGLLIITEIFDESGASKTFEYNRTAVGMSRPQTIDQIAKELVDTYNWVDMGLGPSRRDLREEFMKTVYSLVLGSVMYLCSTVLDTEVVPKGRVRRAVGKGEKPFAVTNIGWKIGPALSRMRREHGERRESVPTGRTMPPHMRRCHFRVVWTGQGRTIPKTVFIAPHWVNKHLLEGDPQSTVRAVR